MFGNMKLALGRPHVKRFDRRHAVGIPRPGRIPPIVKKNARLRPYFRHYITGRIYWARDYGHKSWPIG